MKVRIKLGDEITFKPTERGKQLLQSKFPAYSNKMPLELFLKAFASEAKGSLQNSEVEINKSFWDILFKK